MKLDDPGVEWNQRAIEGSIQFGTQLVGREQLPRPDDAQVFESYVLRNRNRDGVSTHGFVDHDVPRRQVRQQSLVHRVAKLDENMPAVRVGPAHGGEKAGGFPGCIQVARSQVNLGCFERCGLQKGRGEEQCRAKIMNSHAHQSAKLRIASYSQHSLN